jgi:hypothetical protein
VDSKRTVFDREYEELGLNWSIEITPPFGEGTNEETSGESELEGATVRFTWDADDEEFTSAFPEGEDGDEDLLEGLTAEFPWASYLPEEGVEADDEWNIAPEALIQTIELGGDMSLTDDQEGMPSAMGQIRGGMDEDWDGEMTATLVGVTEVDGRAQAAISIEVDVSIERDNTEEARAEMEQPDDLPEGAVIPDLESMEIETTFEGEGTLVWDVDGGYLVSLELELEIESIQTVQLVVEFGGQSMDIEQVMVFEGERPAVDTSAVSANTYSSPRHVRPAEVAPWALGYSAVSAWRAFLASASSGSSSRARANAARAPSVFPCSEWIWPLRQ